MAVAVRLPDMGTNVEECKLLAWRVQEGEPVKRGQVLADIETDKAVAELESTAEGVLLRQAVKPETMARTGDVLAYIGQPGEALPDERASSPAPGASASGSTAEASVTHPEPAARVPVRCSPVVRNLAAKLGVDLSTVRGTGAAGMITREDVLAVAKGPAAATAPHTGEPLSRNQLAVARAVSKSWREIPHFYVSTLVDMSTAQELREQARSGSEPPSYDAIVLKAMARAIQSVPMVAARLEGDRVVKPNGIHIALAVGIEAELFLPVVQDVDRKDMRALQTELAALVSSARAGTLRPEQLTGGCMALSNLGMYPVHDFNGIIFPEHSAILTVGTIQKTPVSIDDRAQVRPMLAATLGVDHRLINGRIAAEFLAQIKQTIESGNWE
jgi:pyruvate dehydrogenase E2 component (dihydrolipoamide acetyltransferase)